MVIRFLNICAMYYLMYECIHATGNIPQELLIVPEGRTGFSRSMDAPMR